VGHIAKGGMDPVGMIREYRELVNHIHFKDMFPDGEWAQTGEGSIDFKTVIDDLVKTDFQGWVVFEDECDAAIGDPDGVTLKDGDYIRDVVKSWIPSRAARFINVVLGGWMLVAPWLLDGGTRISVWSDGAAGLAVIFLSLPRGRVEDRYGSWDRRIV
jgi:hypothetical protein